MQFWQKMTMHPAFSQPVVGNEQHNVVIAAPGEDERKKGKETKLTNCFRDLCFPPCLGKPPLAWVGSLTFWEHLQENNDCV